MSNAAERLCVQDLQRSAHHGASKDLIISSRAAVKYIEPWEAHPPSHASLACGTFAIRCDATAFASSADKDAFAALAFSSCRRDMSNSHLCTGSCCAQHRWKREHVGQVINKPLLWLQDVVNKRFERICQGNRCDDTRARQDELSSNLIGILPPDVRRANDTIALLKTHILSLLQFSMSIVSGRATEEPCIQCDAVAAFVFLTTCALPEADSTR